MDLGNKEMRNEVFKYFIFEYICHIEGYTYKQEVGRMTVMGKWKERF